MNSGKFDSSSHFLGTADELFQLYADGQMGWSNWREEDIHALMEGGLELPSISFTTGNEWQTVQALGRLFYEQHRGIGDLVEFCQKNLSPSDMTDAVRGWTFALMRAFKLELPNGGLNCWPAELASTN